MCLLRVELRGSSANAMVPRLSSKNRTHDQLSSRQINDNTAPVHEASFTPSRRAKYPASAVDNATHLCVLLAQLTAAPPKVISVPDTDRLSLDLSLRFIGVVGISVGIALRSQIQPRTPHKSQPHTPCPVEVRHDLHK